MGNIPTTAGGTGGTGASATLDPTCTGTGTIIFNIGIPLGNADTHYNTDPSYPVNVLQKCLDQDQITTWDAGDVKCGLYERCSGGSYSCKCKTANTCNSYEGTKQTGSNCQNYNLGLCNCQGLNGTHEIIKTTEWNCFSIPSSSYYSSSGIRPILTITSMNSTSFKRSVS